MVLNLKRKGLQRPRESHMTQRQTGQQIKGTTAGLLQKPVVNREVEDTTWLTGCCASSLQNRENTDLCL